MPSIEPTRFPERPTPAQAIVEVTRFFEALQNADPRTAEAAVVHAFGDWWPHQVRGLWMELVVPWLEERGRRAEANLDDDFTWRTLDWLTKIGFEKEAHWSADGESFFVNVTYDGVVTDVSADFSLRQTSDGWVLQRDIIHVA